MAVHSPVRVWARVVGAMAQWWMVMSWSRVTSTWPVDSRIRRNSSPQGCPRQPGEGRGIHVRSPAEPPEGIQDRHPVDRRRAKWGRPVGVGAGAGVLAGVGLFFTPVVRYIRTMPHPAHSPVPRSRWLVARSQRWAPVIAQPPASGSAARTVARVAVRHPPRGLGDCRLRPLGGSLPRGRRHTGSRGIPRGRSLAPSRLGSPVPGGGDRRIPAGR